eukprot:UN13270
MTKVIEEKEKDLRKPRKQENNHSRKTKTREIRKKKINSRK